jgi:hypothetical protein
MAMGREQIAEQAQVQRIILDNDYPFCHQFSMTQDDRAMTAPYSKQTDAQTIALLVIGWIVADIGRAERFLAMTGLDSEQLRNGLGEKAIQLAALDFLSGHEPDLIACAADLGEKPETLATAREGLGA